MPSKTDVLIIGAGPVGLTLACDLKRRGLNVRIIEKLAEPTTQSRALGLQAHALDVFGKLGVLDQILQQGLPVNTVHLYENGHQIGMYSLAALPIAHPFVLIIPQADTEAILNAHFEKLGGRVERNLSLVGLEDSKAIIAHPNGTTETISADWIAGCDGAHSAVRHAMDIPFKGTKFAENFVLADAVIPHFSLTEGINGFLNNSAILGVIPFREKNHFRLFTVTQKQVEPQDLTTAFWQNLLQERSGQPLSIEQITWTSKFTVHRRIVPQMSKGPVFLCGDAAHIHSPAGGQGLNIGIQDSFNLGWKLALVQQGHASPELLETYQEERLPIARHTLWGTTFATFFVASPHTALRRFFFKAIAWAFRTNFFKNRLAMAISGVKTRYRHSRLSRQPLKDIFWKGPRPGDIAPVADLSEETRFTLIVFGAPDYQPDIPAGLFKILNIPLTDERAESYGAQQPCLYLVRPDGFIGYRSKMPAPNLNKTLKRLFLK
jgi:2-polyprenyl-6-methoxyphenol hydroxylase-like FAD-dependent oxidoreductase